MLARGSSPSWRWRPRRRPGRRPSRCRACWATRRCSSSMAARPGPWRPARPGKGVKVLSTRATRPRSKLGGERLTLRVGEAPASVGGGGGGAAGGSRIVLTGGQRRPLHGPGRHQRPRRLLHGRHRRLHRSACRRADAERIGLDYKRGQPVRLNTANGVALGWRVKLGSVRVGDVEVRDVDAVVMPGRPCPSCCWATASSPASRCAATNDQMVLERRY